MKKCLAMLLLLLLVVNVLSACGGKSTKESGTSKGGNNTDGSGTAKEEPYRATFMYFVASDAVDQSLVNEQINKLSLEQLNMTIDVLPVTLGTYNQQIQLMLSGGEPLDVFPVFSGNAGTYVESQYIVDISELIYEKGQDILEIVGEEDVWTSSIGDFLWGVTTMRERANPLGLVVRTDILNETGIKAEDIQSLADITALFAKVKETRPEMTVYGGQSNLSIAQIATVYDTLGDNFGGLLNFGQTTTVINWYETDEFRGYVDVMRDWYVKGYTSKDLPTSTDMGEMLMRAGNLFSFSCPYKPNTKQEKDSMTGYDTTIIEITKPMLTTSTTAGIGYGIANNAENPKKAMELLNWVISSPELNNLINWGIENIHWVKQEDGTITYPEGVTAENVGYHQNFGWALPNQFAAHVWSGNDPSIFKSYEVIRESAIMSKAYGFTFDNAPVINEVAAATAVVDRYLVAICTGSVDPDRGIKEFNDALYNAGLQKIMDEKQRQLDAWLASR